MQASWGVASIRVSFLWLGFGQKRRKPELRTDFSLWYLIWSLQCCGALLLFVVFGVAFIRVLFVVEPLLLFGGGGGHTSVISFAIINDANLFPSAISVTYDGSQAY